MKSVVDYSHHIMETQIDNTASGSILNTWALMMEDGISITIYAITVSSSMTERMVLLNTNVLAIILPITVIQPEMIVSGSTKEIKFHMISSTHGTLSTQLIRFAQTTKLLNLALNTNV
jgi:hypothetical protein